MFTTLFYPLCPNLNVIYTYKKVTSLHFTVVCWPPPYNSNSGMIFNINLIIAFGFLQLAFDKVQELLLVCTQNWTDIYTHSYRI